MSKRDMAAAELVLDECANELVCAITLELPFEPVMAEDGRIYEKDAIETWIRRRVEIGEPIKSPSTNEPRQFGQRKSPFR